MKVDGKLVIGGIALIAALGAAFSPLDAAWKWMHNAYALEAHIHSGHLTIAAYNMIQRDIYIRDLKDKIDEADAEGNSPKMEMYENKLEAACEVLQLENIPNERC